MAYDDLGVPIRIGVEFGVGTNVGSGVGVGVGVGVGAGVVVGVGVGVGVGCTTTAVVATTGGDDTEGEPLPGTFVTYRVTCWFGCSG